VLIFSASFEGGGLIASLTMIRKHGADGTALPPPKTKCLPQAQTEERGCHGLLRAVRVTPASCSGARGWGPTLLTTATMGVLFAGGAGPAVRCRAASHCAPEKTGQTNAGGLSRAWRVRHPPFWFLLHLAGEAVMRIFAAALEGAIELACLAAFLTVTVGWLAGAAGHF
jgi:hypothetical protein